MSQLPVSEAATRLGISVRRVHELIHDKSLPAKKVSRYWFVSESAVQDLMNRRPVRPMGQQMAELLIGALSGQQPNLTGVPKARLAAARAKLLADPSPAHLLAAWLRGHGEVQRYFVSPHDLADLRLDPLLVLSGESDDRSEVNAYGSVEAHIEWRHLEALTADYGLSPAVSVDPNLFLHISDEPLPQQLPLGVVIADLAARPDPRREAMANQLIKKALA